MLKPIGPRVLVKFVDQPRLQSETIIIPETADSEEKSNFAIVLAVGSGVRENINVADTVVLSKYSGAPVTVDFDGEKLEAAIVMESDVLGIYTEN